MSTRPNATAITRPGTLAEALRRARPVEAFDEAAFRTALAEFLDAFYLDETRSGRKARVADNPGLTGISRIDAYVGAVGEHLCRRWDLGEPPAWTDAPERFLHWPTFLGPERMKGFHLAESPSAFRRRMLFTEAEPLRRARMPRDGRWWAYEEMRSGLRPEPGEVAGAEQAFQAEE